MWGNGKYTYTSAARWRIMVSRKSICAIELQAEKPLFSSSCLLARTTYRPIGFSDLLGRYFFKHDWCEPVSTRKATDSIFCVGNIWTCQEKKNFGKLSAGIPCHSCLQSYLLHMGNNYLVRILVSVTWKRSTPYSAILQFKKQVISLKKQTNKHLQIRKW